MRFYALIIEKIMHTEEKATMQIESIEPIEPPERATAQSAEIITYIVTPTTPKKTFKLGCWLDGDELPPLFHWDEADTVSSDCLF